MKWKLNEIHPSIKLSLVAAAFAAQQASWQKFIKRHKAMEEVAWFSHALPEPLSTSSFF